jgi:cytochrome c553
LFQKGEKVRRKTLIPLLLITTLLLALAACSGGGETGGGSAAAAAGETLFSQQIIGAQPGCITCHSLEPDTVIVGPSMAGVASRAPERVPGQSAEEYLRTSILNPDAYVVDGYTAGVMVQVWADELTDQQVDELVAYLQTLE